MKLCFKIVIYILCLKSFEVFAQKKDTIWITASNLNVSNLNTGESRYLVYIKKDKNSPGSDMQIWNITTEKTVFNGQKAFAVNQKWEFRDTVFHTSNSICAEAGFKPFFHESWWKGRGKQTFNALTNELLLKDKRITESDSTKKDKLIFESFKTSFNQYYLNWHLDMEIFAMLPYKKKVTFVIPFYEFGYNKPERIYYTVTDEAILTTLENKKIKCWILKHEEEGNLETYWISKETHEVLKLEQLINGKMYRYKIKLPF